MSSLDEANNFVNCVMNRYKSDTIMRTGATFILILVPFMAMGLGSAILSFRENTMEIEEYLASVITMMFWFFLLIMMYMTYRRLEDHSNRDRIWRDILIHYAEERGCSTVELKRRDRECRNRESTSTMIPASMILAVFFVAFVLMICYQKVFYYEFGIRLTETTVVIIGAAINFVMFILVYMYSMKYPYLHESSQVKFVQEFRYTMHQDGFDVPEMIPSVRHMWLIIHLFLFMITGGLYGLYLIFMVYRSTNNHLFNQWSYEIRLMNAMIEHEGGNGIVAVDKKVKG